MGIGNLGFSEMLVIAVLVLIFFGPRRMPEIGRAVGRALREFRRGLNEIQRELQEAERAASVDLDKPDKPEAETRSGPPSALAAALGTTTGTGTAAANPEGESRSESDEPAEPAADRADGTDETASRSE